MFIRARACSSPTSMIPLDPTLTVHWTPPTLQLSNPPTLQLSSFLLWGQLVVSRALQCGGKAPARLDCVCTGRCAPGMDLLVTYWSERGKRIWWWEEEGHQNCSPTMEHQMRKEISRIYGGVGHVLETPAPADEEKSWWGKRTAGEGGGADVGEKEDTAVNGQQQDGSRLRGKLLLRKMMSIALQRWQSCLSLELRRVICPTLDAHSHSLLLASPFPFLSLFLFSIALFPFLF